MSIRPASISDVNQICNLLKELGGYDDTHTYLPNKLQDIIDHPDHYLYVYENNEILEGLVSLFIVPELGLNGNTALITYLIVTTNSRSTGIGKILEEQCCIVAKERNCARIQLHCAANRIRAHKFYQDINYTESPKYFSKKIS